MPFSFKTQNVQLLRAVYAGIAASLFASVGLGLLLLEGANTPLWESVFGALAAFMAGGLIVQIQKNKNSELGVRQAGVTASMAAFLFTLVMITREGMELTVLILSVQDVLLITGIVLGLLLAAGLSFLWARFSHQVSSHRFFQVSTTFLLLFVAQMLLYSFHELTEAGEIIPNTDYWHEATEPFSHDGLYGKWLAPLTLGFCGIWLVVAWVQERLSKQTVA